MQPTRHRATSTFHVARATAPPHPIFRQLSRYLEGPLVGYEAFERRQSARGFLFKASPGLQEMVQCGLPYLHEIPIMVRGKFPHKFIAGRANAGVAIPHIRKTALLVFRK